MREDDQVAPLQQRGVVEGGDIHLEDRVGDKHAGGEGDAERDTGEHKGHDDAGKEAGYDEILDGLGVVHAEGVDLLGDDHASDLGGDAGADTGCQHERSDGGCELAEEELQVECSHALQIPDDALGLKAGLEDEDHAEEAEHDHDKGERAVADKEALLHDLAPADGLLEGVVECQAAHAQDVGHLRDDGHEDDPELGNAPMRRTQRGHIGLGVLGHRRRFRASGESR